MSLSLYIHVPFCSSRCTYCDFYVVAGQRNAELEKIYTTSLLKEMEFYSDHHGASIDTIFFGGGTPNYLSLHHYDTIFKGLHQYYKIQPNAEITMEMNPDKVTPESVYYLKNIGINRVSLGVQSLNDNLISTIGRKQTVQQVHKALELVKENGFSVNVDFIYDIPNQTPATIHYDINQILPYDIQHISYYGLTLKAPNPILKLYSDDPNASLELYQTVMDLLPSLGFQRYEISNFAKPGQECRHNLVYWEDKAYLGLGPSASSYINTSSWGIRWTNIANLKQYADAMIAGKPEFAEFEELDMKKSIIDYMMTGLRLTKGILKPNFKEKYARDISDYYSPTISSYLKNKYMIETENKVILTPLGMRYTDTVVYEFMKMVNNGRK